MKSAWFSNTVLLVILSVSLFACKDKNETTVTPPPVVGGKGGLATVRVVMVHSGLDIDSGKVYIKYNAVVVPKENKYDDSCAVFMVEGRPTAIFTNLTQGEYFIGGGGWDIIRSQTVRGTRPYTIPESGKNGINTIELQVSQ